MNDDLANPINVFEQITSVCSDFRRQLKSGEQARIEDLLESFDSEARENLFRNLLNIDIDFRRRAQSCPTSEEYIKRFPEYARLIRQVFYESTMMSMDASVSTPRHLLQDQAGDMTLDMPVLAANRLGDYQLIKEIGRGGFGTVYCARHVQRQSHVALKTLPIGQDRQGIDDAERLHKFRREFRSLADINHPNLIGMQTLEVDGNQWFFTMDLIEGSDFLEYVRPDDQLNEQRLREVLPQLANGIMALHGQRIIHRDLKPSNVMVDNDGKVTILDFGLVVELEQRTDQTMSMQSSRFAGTPLYAAPEQIVGTSTSASDWYALGVMLYEAISGARPFSGSPVEVFNQKQRREPPSLVDREEFPQDLSKFALALMQTDPADRPDPLEIAKSLSIETESRTPASMDEQLAETMDGSDQFLIGREKQLADLESLLQQLMKERKPISVFITGRSGEGKSSLAEKFMEPLRLGTDVLVLSGRCYDRESVPFKAIDSMIDALVAYLRGRTNLDVESILPGDVKLLAHLFPVMKRVDAIAEMAKTPIGQLDSKQIRHRAFEALRGLLQGVSQTTPIVMFIDDLQWGDADSASVLFQMLLSSKSPSMLFMGSYRHDEAAESPFLTVWEKLNVEKNAEHVRPNIAVGPLSELQCVLLVVNRIGIDNSSIRQKASELYQATGGNPYFLDQLIDCFDPETGTFSPAPLHEVIDSKLEKLPSDAPQLLKIIAVAGQSLSLQEAARVAGLVGTAFATVTHMRSERLVRLIGSEEQQLVDTYHDKIRETVLDQMADDGRRELHQRIGETIEEDEGASIERLQALIEQESSKPLPSPARVFDLAYHFDAAGDQKRAAIYSFLAADQAKRQFALKIAIENYRRADQFAGQFVSRVRYRIKTGLGETLLLGGEYEFANEALDEAIEFASGQHERIAVQTKQAQISYYTKSLVESIDAYDSLLGELGIRISRTRFGIRFALFRQIMRAKVRSIFRQSLDSRKQEMDWKTAQRAEILRHEGHPALFRGPYRSLLTYATGINLVAPYRESQIHGFFHAGLTLLHTIIAGSISNGRRHYQEAIRIASDRDDITISASANFYLGWGLPTLGEFKESLDAFERAENEFNKIGDVYRTTFIRTERSRVHLRLGNIQQCVMDASESFEAAVRFGQNRLAQSALEPWAIAVGGDLPFTELKSCIREVPDDLATTIHLLVAESTWHRFHGRTSAALNRAERAVKVLRQYNLIFGACTIALPTLANALRVRAAELKEERSVEYKPLLQRCLRVSKWAEKVARKYVLDRPYALRELSLAQALANRTKLAWKFAQSSCEVAKQQDAKHEYAKSLLVSGQLGEKLGLPDAQWNVERAKELLSEFEQQIEQAKLKAFVKPGG